MPVYDYFICCRVAMKMYWRFIRGRTLYVISHIFGMHKDCLL